jgi:glycosyltransferase involved in cell wall biosynthesis
MRIALVVAGGVDRGGRERVTPALLWLIERLARRHQVFVYVLRYHHQPCTYPLLGATIRDLGSPTGVVRQYRSLTTAMRRDGPFDVVHGYLGLPAGLVAALAGRRLGVPPLVTFDSGELVALRDIDYGLQVRLRQRLAIAAAARLAARLTVCTRYQQRLATALGFDPVVVPLGVDAGTFTSASHATERSPAVDASGRRRVLHVASLNRVKDQATLLKAFALVDGAHLDIAGEDTLGGAVQAVARDLGLADRVTFHGFQPTDRLVGLYRRADLFVLSSRHDAANVAVLEAAASGVPCAGTHVGYLADWSPDRAATVAPGDHLALGRAISDLLADSARRVRLASAAREWTLAHDADSTAAAFEDTYLQLRIRK